jgi:hypothetical protein
MIALGPHVDDSIYQTTRVERSFLINSYEI